MKVGTLDPGVKRGPVSHAVDEPTPDPKFDGLSSNFVGIVSHDVRGPAGNIIGYADLLLREEQEFSLPPAQRRMVERIRDNGQFILDLVHDLLDTVRIDAGTLKLTLGRHDVGAMIGECLQRSALLAAATQVGLRSVCPPGTIHAVLDRSRMLQVLMNLVSNAVKFSPEGSTVTVGADQASRETSLWVSDSGQGIRPEEIQNLCKKFARSSTRPVRGEKGAGLGLYIANEFTKLHRGSLAIESTLGEGSRFTACLPRGRAVPR